MSKVGEFYRELEQKGFSMQEINYMLEKAVESIKADEIKQGINDVIKKKDVDIDCDVEAKTIGVENE